MANIGDLLQSRQEQKEQWKENKQAEREELSAIIDNGLDEVTGSAGKFVQYLRMQAKIPAYGASNTILIMAQRPGVTEVRSMRQWNKLGRSINRGESGIKILVPEEYSYQQKVERRDDYSGEVYTEQVHREGRGYKVGRVFDLLQTNGRLAPRHPELAEGTHQLDAGLRALLDLSPAPVVSRETLAQPARYDEQNAVIFVQPEAGGGEMFRALAAEIGHARIHDGGRFQDYRREDFSLDADSVSFILCQRFGVQTPTPDFSQVSELYGGLEKEDKRMFLDGIQSLAEKLGNRVEREVSPQQQARTAPDFRRGR